MYCRVCGTEENVSRRPSKHLVLCDSCNRETPRKASRENFERVYWENVDDVPRSIRNEFYSDYLTSTHTLAEYVEATTEIL